MGDNPTLAILNILPVSQAFGTAVGGSKIPDTDVWITNMTDHPIFKGVEEIYMKSAGSLSATSPASAAAWADSGEAVVSVAELSGHVVVLGDYNLFIDIYLSESSNRLFAENVFEWLANEPIAGEICLQDALYSGEYFLTVEENGILIGQAVDSSDDLTAPLTGYFNAEQNTFSFSIGYPNNNTRHYLINVLDFTGYTWELRGTDSGFKELPRKATLVDCNLP
jgi:hypothetical protein